MQSREGLFYILFLLYICQCFCDCPHGFVVSESGDDSAWFIGNGTCAVSCKISPMYTPDQWKAIKAAKFIISYLGFSVICILLLVWLIKFDSTKNIIVTFGFITFVQLLFSIGTKTVNSDFSMFCRNDAELVSANDGMNKCAAESFISLYALLAINLCWAVQSVRLFKSIVLGLKEDKLLRLWQSSLIIFGLPLPSLFIVYFTRSWGYSWGQIGCLFSQEASYTRIPILTFYGPILLCFIIASVSLIAVLCKIYSLRSVILSQEVFVTNAKSSSQITAMPNEISVNSGNRPIATKCSTSTKSSTAWSPGDFVLEGDEWDDKQKYMSSKRGQEESECSMYNSGERIMNEFAFLEPSPQLLYKNILDIIPEIDYNNDASQSDIELCNESPQKRKCKPAVRPGLMQVWKATIRFRFLVGFVLLYALVGGCFVVMAVMFSFTYRPTARAAFIQWAECVINNFDGTDESWKSVCGVQPTHQIAVPVRILLMMINGGQPLCVFLLYIPEVCATFWKLAQTRKVI